MFELTAIIIDDDKRCSDLVCNLLSRSDISVSVEAVYNNPMEAIEAAPWEKATLLFLDVEMPQLSGFQLIDFINNDRLQIIMTTGHEEFAIPALKRDVCDYLMKPVSPNDLRESLMRAMKRLQRASEQVSHESNRVTIPTANGFSVVDIRNIKRLESTNNYTYLHMQDQKEPLLVSKPLRAFERLLPDTQFVRINQSNIVNIDYVERFDRASGGTITLKEVTHDFLLGRVYRDRFLRFFRTQWS